MLKTFMMAFVIAGGGVAAAAVPIVGAGATTTRSIELEIEAFSMQQMRADRGDGELWGDAADPVRAVFVLIDTGILCVLRSQCCEISM